jgi:hypothetical protein
MIAVAASLGFAAVGDSAPILPASVTLDGVGGIKIGSTSTAVAHLLRAPIVLISESSGALAYVPICAGRMHGGAEFSGGDGNLKQIGGEVLTRIWFSSGATTPRHVGVGSTRTQVIAAYGSSLQRDRRNHVSNLFLAGKPISFGGHAVRPTIYFLFNGETVVALGYGIKADLVGTGGWAVGISQRTFCG